MSSLKIHPLHVGTITRQVSTFCHLLDPGKLIDVPLICWYIEGSEKRILVDTGGGDPSKAHPRRFPYMREEDQSVENALKKKGVTCEDIDVVIVTHLHWDHCGGNELFSKAKMIVQGEELHSARSPLPAFSHAYIKSAVDNVDYTVISGDQQVEKGVSVILTPGHTDGLQGVYVEAKRNRYLIASDAVPLFRNLEEDPPLISGVYVDMRSYYESFKKIKKLSAFVLPGHDFKVFEKEIYD